MRESARMSPAPSFLTAKIEEADKVIKGLMLGGDDYIEPFSIEELGTGGSPSAKEERIKRKSR